MKGNTNKKSIQKIIIALIMVIILNFAVPINAYSAGWDDIGGKLLKEVVQFVVAIGDAVTGMFNWAMLGTDAGSSMINRETLEYNIQDSETVFYAGDAAPDEIIKDGEMDKQGIFEGVYEYPNMLHSPENIFANKIAMLDVNFLKPNTYKSVVTGEEVTYSETEEDRQISAAAFLSPTIASWYRSFRNIAIVGLLTVLVYIGIKILLSSTAADKAKYLESIRDWVVALCLVFAIHIIMSGILMLTEQVNKLFESTATSIIVEDQTGGESIKFKTNLMGFVRFKAQSESWQEAVGFSIMYLVLIIYTGIFTFQYFKRVLYMAFFTMIAPLVAITYPIDKVGDGKAQAFNMWFKEYTMNAIIQPIHLILYTALVATSTSLAVKNPIYALVAIGFMIPAEKFIKKMFGVESESTSGMGSFAGGALAMSGLQKLASMGKKSGGKGGSSGGKDSADDGNNGTIRFPGNNSGGTFDSFDNDSSSNGGQVINGVSHHNGQGQEQEDENQTDQQRMLDAYDEGYGTDEWDAAERDAYAREAYRDEPGMDYSDEEYEQILRDSGYDENEIEAMMAERRGETPEQRMLDAYDEGYGTDEWDAAERDAYARSAYGNSGGMDYSDDEYENILRDSGYDENEIAAMMAERRGEEPIADVEPPEQQVSGIQTANEENTEQIRQNETSEESVPEQQDSNNNQVAKGWKGRFIKSGVKKLGPTVYKGGKKALKGAAILAGGAAGATIGLAAGIATGDPSKVFTNTLAGGVAGGAIGKNGINAVGRTKETVKAIPGKFEKVSNGIKYTADEAKYGEQVARKNQRERENEAATKKFLKDEKSREKWDEVRGKLGYEGSTDDFMKIVADYKKAEPKMDDKMIENALKLEKEYGNKKIGGSAHKQVVDVAKFTSKNNYGREYVEDKEKRSVLDKHIDSQISNENARKQIKEMHAKLNGVGHLRK